jgi:hypothetical protein
MFHHELNMQLDDQFKQIYIEVCVTIRLLALEPDYTGVMEAHRLISWQEKGTHFRALPHVITAYFGDQIGEINTVTGPSLSCTHKHCYSHIFILNYHVINCALHSLLIHHS